MNPDEDSAVFDKLREAGELYKVYADLTATAEHAILAGGAAEAAADEEQALFRPLPLTIAFRRTV